MLKRISELEKKVKEITTEIKEIKSQCKGTKLADLKPGEEFLIAGRKFIVMDHVESGTKVICQNLWGKDVKFGRNRNYKESSLKKYLEEKILPELESALGTENIVEHEADLTAVDGKNEFGKVTCKIRPITFMEAREYTDLLENKDIESYWWTCTPWSTEERGWQYSVTVVSPSGVFDGYDCNFSFGVRPVCILKSDLFVSLVEE